MSDVWSVAHMLYLEIAHFFDTDYDSFIPSPKLNKKLR